MLEPAAIQGGLWRWTPVPIRSLSARALATGFYAVVLFALPTFLLAWASVGGGRMNGYSYTCFKGVWGMIVSALVYALVFPAAICKHDFPDLEFEELSALAGASDAPPLVANPESVKW